MQGERCWGGQWSRAVSVQHVDLASPPFLRRGRATSENPGDGQAVVMLLMGRII